IAVARRGLSGICAALRQLQPDRDRDRVYAHTVRPGDRLAAHEPDLRRELPVERPVRDATSVFLPRLLDTCGARDTDSGPSRDLGPPETHRTEERPYRRLGRAPAR